ncbi:MAG: DUF1566 domain-containing protein [Flavobacteriales bacterium]|nr:DUF1566 domain-containing protein [Flavobacteriales bacterium]
MKQILIIIVFTLSSVHVFAQTPEKFNYQGVARDGNGGVIADEVIAVRFTILDGDLTEHYKEEWNVFTNEFGLFDMKIGNGFVLQGDFTSISWGEASYYLRVELDPTGGTSYQNMGTTQLVSVPYALYSKDTEAGKYKVGDYALGGIVFYVDETERHGLVCYNQDLGFGARWYMGTYGESFATGDGMYAGEMNTLIMITGQMVLGSDGGGNAATACAELSANGFADWCLPSKAELNQIYWNRDVINAAIQANFGVVLSTEIYWSSTESNNNWAHSQNFTTGGQGTNNKSDYHLVRPIRKF